MADAEKKGMELLAQADKKAKSPAGFFGSFFGGGSSRMEEAADLYVRAANSFKMAKKWSAAGNAFCEAAQCQMKQQSKHESASSYVEAANCFRKADPNEAVKCLMKGVDIFTDMGRFTIAAKHHMTIAEIYETDIMDLDQAIEHYGHAGDYYKGEESTSSANKCWLKVAQYSAQQEKYSKAIEIYEQVGQTSMDNQLLRYGAKDYFFKAAICRMCQDIEDADVNLAKYKDIFPAFGDTREFKLCQKLIECVRDHNADAFGEAVREYDSISRLDQWYTTMLLRVKKSIEGEVDLK